MSMRRLAVAWVGVAGLAVCVGSAWAKPKRGITLEGLDPEFAKQLAPRVMTKEQANDIVKQGRPTLDAPKFAIKHLDPGQRAQILGAGDPAALPATLVFDARTDYHDDATFMELLPGDGAVTVRSLRNYLFFTASDAVAASRFTRPTALIHFKAAANTRYLLECSVDAGEPTVFSASDTRGEYTVSTDDRATLLYIRDQAGGAEDVVVQLGGDSGRWYLDGCELTASPR